MRSGKRSCTGKKCRGFTLFEMVVVICSIVILYMVAEQRMNQLPAAAERASYFAILDQLKIAVNFEMYTRMARGDFTGIQGLEGTNPMALLLETPRNYRGELAVVTDRNIERRGSWYFETSTGELVYVVGGASIEDVVMDIGSIAVNYGQIRLRLANVYSDRRQPGNVENSGHIPADSPRWEALLLQPKWEYTWLERQATPVPI